MTRCETQGGILIEKGTSLNLYYIWLLFFINQFNTQIFTKLQIRKVPNRHKTWNRRQFDVDITSVCRKQNIDEFPRLLHVLFRMKFRLAKNRHRFNVLFLTYFDERNFGDVSTHIFRPNFDGRKVDLISMYLFQPNFDGLKINVASIYFFSII